MTRARRRLYRGTGQAMLRAAVHVKGPIMAAWPDRAATLDDWRAWLGMVWADTAFRDAVGHASPDLADRVEAILDGRTPNPKRARRAALATARYAIRYACRSAPYGLFAGVAQIGFGDTASVQFGDDHQVLTRPHPVPVDEAISSWEADATLMADVDVRVHPLAQQRDGHVYVPSEGDAEFRLALSSPALRFVLGAAQAPIRYSRLADKVAAEFPATTVHARARLLGDLLRVRLLRSSLRAPATDVDPVESLPPDLRTRVRGRATAADLRLDAAVQMPSEVMTEAETAATVLARLATHPNGTPAWRRWVEQFTERYGEDTAVPVEAATDTEHGIGFPSGFVDADEPPRPMSRRDRLLLELAGTAAVQGTRSVSLTGAMIEQLEAAGEHPRLTTPHLELAAQLHASSIQALERGNFRLQVSTVSRSAGSMTGRFWHLLPEAGAAHTALPTIEPGAEVAQLSFHAGRVSADLLTRAPRVLPRVVSVGEFRYPGDGVLFPSDLAMSVHDGRPRLVEIATGTILELLAPTAINFVWNHYTPPMARFLAEISRATAPQVTWFDWGVAWTLPFTPTLTYRRSILTVARWKLRARDLPRRTAPLQEWTEQLRAWQQRFRVPDRVLLAEDDQHLPLDLRETMHRDLLRAHVDAGPVGVATLHDAAPPDADDWIGGRAHSIVFPLTARA